jgi:hypothetical protein
MTSIELKSDLHKLIDKTEDVNVLKSIYLLLNRITEKKDKDFWDLLSEEERLSVEKGIEESIKGELYSNDDVMREVKAKYGL